MTSAPTIASSHTHVGTPPPDYDGEWLTHSVHVHGFESLSVARGGSFDSPEFMLLGNQWILEIFPGGDEGAAEGMVSIFLWNRSNKAIDIDFGFSVNDENGKQVAYERTATPQNFASVGGDDGIRARGCHFVKRSKLMSSLVKGTLVIQVRMRLSVPQISSLLPFIPENPLTKMIQGVFLEEKSTDIVFEVGLDQPRNNATRVARRFTPVTFSAHRLIIENCSSVFADLCESHCHGTTLVQINDVAPNIFRLLLRYIYGGKLSDDDMKSHAKEIIDAADRFGVSSLKMEAEACFVDGTDFTIENVMEHLLYAESKNCALLKEASMDYIVENKAEVIERLSFADTVPGTLMRDLLVATARGERNVDGSDGDVDDQSHFNSMRISELRKRAHEKGLNVDGSREVLIAALEAVQNLESEVGLEDGSSSSDEEPEED